MRNIYHLTGKRIRTYYEVSFAYPTYLFVRKVSTKKKAIRLIKAYLQSNISDYITLRRLTDIWFNDCGPKKDFMTFITGSFTKLDGEVIDNDFFRELPTK